MMNIVINNVKQDVYKEMVKIKDENPSINESVILKFKYNGLKPEGTVTIERIEGTEEITWGLILGVLLRNV